MIKYQIQGVDDKFQLEIDSNDTILLVKNEIAK
jgi:hypothetical protein